MAIAIERRSGVTHFRYCFEGHPLPYCGVPDTVDVEGDLSLVVRLVEKVSFSFNDHTQNCNLDDSRRFAETMKPH
jgi:hypothetical protein